jgi:Flp pilus assembly protein TadG
MILRIFQRLLADESGNSAVELAMVAPVIAGVAVVSFGVWTSGSENQDARAALDAGAEYYMAGGSTDSAARDVATNAWRHRPGDGTITSSRNYKCGETVATETTICTGGRTVATYVTLVATGGGEDQHSIHEERVVRVR